LFIYFGISHLQRLVSNTLARISPSKEAM